MSLNNQMVSLPIRDTTRASRTGTIEEQTGGVRGMQDQDSNVIMGAATGLIMVIARLFYRLDSSRSTFRPSNIPLNEWYVDDLDEGR
jgi:hypothetical protein